MRVTIFDTEYPIRADDEVLVSQLARQVDRMMRDLRRQAPDQPPLSLAVLTALNLAETLYHERHSHEGRQEEWAVELSKMAGYLDSVLAADEAAAPLSVGFDPAPRPA